MSQTHKVDNQLITHSISNNYKNSDFIFEFYVIVNITFGLSSVILVLRFTVCYSLASSI